jgi:hypothetical protein
MELTEEENNIYIKEKTEYNNKILEHIKQKDEYIKLGDYEKAKQENQIVENLRTSLQDLELKKLQDIKNKQISKLSFNYDETLKQTKLKYEIRIKTAEQKYEQFFQKLKEKRKQELKEVEIKYAYQQKHSPEYKAMEEEEKKLLEMNRFDEAIALQKLRKKKEEEDNIRYKLIHKNEIENLKRNVEINYNKEYTNFQNRKNNEIEMIKKEMNIALDNLDKRFNKRRKDLISLQKNKELIKNNIQLAKCRFLFNNQGIDNNKNNIKRIFSPTNLNRNNKNTSSIKKSPIKKKRKQSAKK